MTWLLVALAGGLGASTRFVVDVLARARWASPFPWATVAINVSGSLLLGFVTGLVMFGGSPNLLGVVLGAGFCGGYTTFSTASFETVRLLQHRRYALAAANAVGTLVLTALACGLGLWLSTW